MFLFEISRFSWIQVCVDRIKQRLTCQKGQFAVDIALGLAVVLIISAFIVLPGLRELATNMMTDIKHWWTTTMTTKVFTAS